MIFRRTNTKCGVLPLADHKVTSMKHSFQTRDIALNLLVLHPQNVRAEYGSGYSTEQMAPLAATIAECGLLQLLLVAPLPDQNGQ